METIRGSSFTRWSLLNLGGNLVAGIPAVIPLWMACYWAANFPLAALDLPLRNPTENDGMLPVLVVILPICFGAVALWWAANRWLRRASAIRGEWTISALATLTPTLLLFLLSG